MSFIPIIKVSNKRLLNYIRRNPGLTTCQLTTLLRGRTATFYTKTSFNTRLIRLVIKGEVVRVKMNAAIADHGGKTAWRHYTPAMFQYLKERSVFPEMIIAHYETKNYRRRKSE